MSYQKLERHFHQNSIGVLDMPDEKQRKIKGTSHTISQMINKYLKILSCLFNVIFYSVHNLAS